MHKLVELTLASQLTLLSILLILLHAQVVLQKRPPNLREAAAMEKVNYVLFLNLPFTQ